MDQRVLSHLASEHLPALSARLIALGLSPAQPCPAWLLAGFAASNMPLATVARLWDVAFFERSGAAFMRYVHACVYVLEGQLAQVPARLEVAPPHIHTSCNCNACVGPTSLPCLYTCLICSFTCVAGGRRV